MNTSLFFKKFLITSFFGLFAVLVFSANPALAALPAGFEIQTVVTGMNLPTGMAFTSDGRIFISEKDGTVRLFRNSTLQPTAVIKLSDVNTYGDRGLLGIAVDPNFLSNGYLYLLYTYENTPGANIAASKTGRLVRVTVVGDVASEASKQVLLGTVGGTITNPSCENYATGTDCIPSDSLSHSVAGLRFGSDNKLYVTIGDGSSFDYADPRSLRAQSLDSLSGKMLRINTDGTAPSDNPFYNGTATSNRSKVYALGFRNSFRFNFRPSNQAIFAGDVGWSNWEEVNLVTPGGNYGWPCREGAGITVAGLGCTPSSATTDPLYTYPHDSNGAGSVTGGSFPQGSVYPATFNNAYFFGDYAQNFIKYLLLDSNNQVLSVNNFANGSDGTDGPVDFVTAPDGTVYFLAIYTGSLKKITYTLGNRQPNAVIGVNQTSGSLPLVVNFTAASSSDPDGNPLTYAWNFGTGATSTLASPTFTYSATGTYTASVKVSDNQGGFDTKSVTVRAGNQAPSASITSPVSGALYVPGTTVQLTGVGSDPETGALTGSSLSWRVIIHHNIHTHILQTMTGVNPTFIAPDHGDPDVYLEVELSATDPSGITTKNSILMYLNNTTQTNGNLIANPSVETPQVGNNTTPDAWFKGGYGVNNAILTYPITGYDGASAMRLEINNYTDGDAKWFFSPVYINENTDYQFSDYYQSNAPSRLSAQFGYTNGTYTYIDFGVIPVSTTWTKLARSFKAPAGARTVTVFHGLSNIGVLSTDAYSLMASSSITVDNVAPVVTLTSPVASSTLSGVVTLTATATDNVGVSGVTFLIDGIVTGTEKLTAPYALTVDTASMTNGTHTFAVRARDAAGNIGNSQSVNITIANVVASSAPNRIINPSLEIVSTTTANTPQGWKSGKFGTNQTMFTYPAPGSVGNGAKVAMTQYTSGDAKWYFNDVSVSAGQVYDLALSYQSNATSSISLRYLLSNSTYSYVTLTAAASPSATWKPMLYRFTVPAGVVSVTAFQALNRVGFISNDEFSLRLVDTIAPVVSISAPVASTTVSGTTTVSAVATDAGGIASVQFAIDGNNIGTQLATSPYTVSVDTTLLTNGSHTLRAVARDFAGNSATATRTFVVSNLPATTTLTNLIPNGNLEIVNGQNPQNWTQGGWGNSTRTFTYPVTGRDGNKAAQLQISNYVDGDGKWTFTSVPVSVGTVYRYDEWYKGTTISDVIGQYTMSDGSLYYFGLIKEVAPTSTWTKITGTFSPPVGANSLTLFHLISSNGTLVIDDAQLYVVGTTTPVTDTISPQVQITAPAASSTVTGSVTLTASSSDNVGVTGVMFAIDGTPISPMITTSPYTFVWDSTSVANGVHSIKATTHDAVGNNNTATINVTVANAGTSTGTSTATSSGQNLIENPSVETAGTGNTPLQWFKGGWGTNTSVLTYPVAGLNSAKAIKVSISNYTNGDAKWYFAPKTVIAGNVYTYSHWYNSDATTTVTLRYTLSDGTYTYVELDTLPSQTDWTKYTKTITIPQNVVAMTSFHSLRGVGNLVTDEFSLVSQTTPVDPKLFNSGMVSLTFDDGWLSHYSTVLPMLNAASMKGSFAIVSLETLDALPVNRINNASFENSSANQPTDWLFSGWGTNDALYSYENTGRTGSYSSKVTITNYTDGDAKWYFKDTTVVDGQLYSFSDYYISDVPTNVTARYYMGAGVYVYADLGEAPAATTWTKFEKQFNMPANVESFTVFHRLTSAGSLSIDDANLSRVQIFVSSAQVLDIQAGNHEIASHSRTHPSLPNISQSEMVDEVTKSKTDLISMGVIKVNTLVYPYGDYNPSVESALLNAGYIGARSVDRGYNTKTTNKLELKTQQVDVTTTLDQIKSWIDTATQNKTWLTLMFHQVDNGGLALSTTPAILQGTVDYLKINNTPVVTLEEGISQMNP